MRIVHLTAEFAPLAKAGGLGEVIVGLARELTRMGEEVQVILPKYDFIDMRHMRNIKMEIPDFKCFEHNSPHANTMWSAEYEEISLKLLEARHPSGYFHRGHIYGAPDDAARFIYFSRAALEYLKCKGQPIDILHLHDWHTALAAVLARALFNLPIKAIVLTIHNAAYQGKCAVWDLDAIGLQGKDYLTPDSLQSDDPRERDIVNLLKGGIIYSDAVVAVSPTYAQEILTSENSYGLEATFHRIQRKLSGILNGLDLQLWDPGSDCFLAAQYQLHEPFDAIIQAKERMRKALRNQFHLSNNGRPWIGAITRLAEQKGPELIEEALEHTLRLGGTFLLLGTFATSKIQKHFEQLKAKCTNKSAILHFAYNEALAHQFYAALDFVVLPSLYEPCGLSQMIAMRYGTVPIGRATGGHKDTIFDWEDQKIPFKNRNGFLFSNFSKTSMASALDRATLFFKEQPSSIKQLIENGMRMDWGWEKPAKKYAQLYKKLTLG